MFRVLIVPDKFKGTLSASGVARAIAAGWRRARPNDHLRLVPMTDGGDGFGPAMESLMGAKVRTIRTVDAAHRPHRARWWMDSAGKTAIIDSAEVIGLALMQRGKFHPFQLDSFGLGPVLQAAALAGARQAIIGIGGSATNDGGFGMARALGWKFFDADWDEIEEWWQLHRLAHVRKPREKLPLKITVAVDVANPLLGPNGCSRIYGPQKGLRPQDFALAEKCLGRLSSILSTKPGIGHAKTPGAGAAGGLGFGLMSFLGATPESGFEIFARLANLDRHIHDADLVITGEGRMDQQTRMGKGVGQVARRCRKFRVPCVALAGTILEPENLRGLFRQARALTAVTTLRDAMASPQKHLKQLAWQVAKETR